MNKICFVCGKPFQESHSAVLCCSIECMGKHHSITFDKSLESRIGQPIKEWLTKQYIENHWTYRQICKALGINTRTLMRYMREFNIPIRNPSEAVKMQWVRNPNRKLNSRNVIIKGVTKRATTFRNNPQLPESALIKELDKRGIKYSFQYPVRAYILDFAFPDKMLDFEIDNPRRAGKYLNRLEKTRIRTAELQTLGWTVIYFRTDADPSFIADNIQKLI